MATLGRSLELFFIDGTPDGMLTAEIFNWTGHVLMAPRIRLPEALRRKEAGFTGVYILVGDTPDSNLQRIYIGESEDVAERIRSHDANKDWWTTAVLITSTANVLNKAHVKYLESRLVEEAKRAGRTVIENGNTPPKPSLTESAQSNMEHFVEQVLLILPAIRVDGFLSKARLIQEISVAQNVAQPPSPVFELTSANGEVLGFAQVENGEFIVQAGSFGRATWIGVEHNYQKLFDEVVKSGSYVLEGSQRKFSAAYAFSSPSAAGAVLTGRATPGPIAWHLKDSPSITYKDWEADQIKN